MEYLVSKWLKTICAQYAERTALVYGNARYSYRELYDAAALCAADLVARGVQPGDHVALWGYNSANWLIAYLGILLSGGAAVLINYGMTADSVRQILAYTDASTLVIGCNHVIREPETDAAETCAAIGYTGSKLYDLRATDFRARLAAGERAELPPIPEDERRTAVIILTTGSTARPKAVELTQYGILHNTEGMAAQMVGNGTGPSYCLGLPLFHSFGMQMSLVTLQQGLKLCLPRAQNADAVIEMLLQEQVSDISSVAMLYSALIMCPAFNETVALQLKKIAIGGSAVTNEQYEILHKAFPNAEIDIGYGLSETSPVVATTYPLKDKRKCLGSVGVPLRDVELRICLPSGEPLPNNITGEVFVKGPNLMKGYYKLPAERQAIDENGWLHTGDLGYLTDEGILYIVGRIKDIIIRGGENIVPVEVESALLHCGGIASAQVVGLPHPTQGESVEAAVILREGVPFQPDMIRKQLAYILAPYKIPAHILVFQRFPVNTVGKLDKLVLRETMAKQIRDMEAQSQTSPEAPKAHAAGPAC